MRNQNELKEKMRKLRKYVAFDYDLRKNIHPNSARKIEKYFDELNALEGLNYKSFIGKTKKQTKTAQTISALSLPQFKFAAIPKSGEIDIIFDKKGSLKIKGKTSDKTFYPFNQKSLARDPEKEIDRVINQIDEKQIMIYTGDYYYRRADDPEKIKSYCLKLINRYGVENTREWLKGLFGVNPTAQFEISEQIKQTDLFLSIRNKNRKRTKRQKLRMK